MTEPYVVMLREDDELLDALGRGDAAPDGDAVAELLARWRESVAAGTVPARPVPAHAAHRRSIHRVQARAVPGDRRPPVWLAAAAAVVLLLVTVAFLSDAPARLIWPGVVNVDPDDTPASPATTTPPTAVPSIPPLLPAPPAPGSSGPVPGSSGGPGAAPATTPPSRSPQPTPTAGGTVILPLPSLPSVALPTPQIDLPKLSLLP